MTEVTTAATGLLAWLESHELGQYHDAMDAQDITLETIVDLEDADLRELGVSIGHRKTLRRAIQELKTSDAAALAAAEPAQRRQLTVLFCDIVGSTQIARKYDAEDMAAILQKYHGLCHEIITRWGGRPLGTQGDGVIACFGLPQAQENDAERCVRAGLEMSAAISNLKFEDGLVLHSRIGISTGRMYVHGNPEESGNVVGDTLNLASRLQDSAAIDSVVLSSSTKRLAEKTTYLDSMGLHEMKGFADPIEIWTAKGMVDFADRIEGAGSAKSNTLIGRTDEIAQLRSLWEDAKMGRGRVAVISGDAGIGKSYILDAVRQFVQEDDHLSIRYFSAPFYENSAMFPIIAQLNHALGFQDRDDQSTRSKKLQALFGNGSATDVPLIADLLSVDIGDAYPPLDMTAPQQKQETFGVLLSHLTTHATERPILILAEDAHWADPTSLEFLSMIVSQAVPENRILLVVTHRPEVDLGWAGHNNVTRMPLGRLTRAQSRKIIDRVMADKVCPQEIVHEIIENADGVPLFVEELARSAAEQMDEDGFRQVNLPSSLEDSLRGRLDRLPSGKDIVQTASVFGRRFYVSLLRPILNMSEKELSPALQGPIDAKIIYPIDDNADETMLFGHALVQQAAYQGLLRTQRKELHARIADLLLENRPGLAETEPETLARHFAGSGQNIEAIQYLTAAGQRAASRAGQIEATNHYQAALDLLKELPASPERDANEVLLQALLGGALMATRGFAATDVYDAFARARSLCLSLGDNPMYCSCLYGLFTVNISRSNKEEAVALADEMLTTFGASPVPSWAIAAHFTAGNVAFFQGNMDEAQAHFEQSVALYTEDQHGPLVEQFGDNLAEFSMCYLQWLHLQKGQIDVSADYLERAVKMADDLNNKNAQTRTVSFRMGRARELEDVATVAAKAPEVINISMTQGYPYWATAGQIGLGWASSGDGTTTGIDMINAGLGFYDMIGQQTPQTYWRTYLVGALINDGRREDALKAIDFALEQSARGIDSFYEAVLRRLKGQVYMMAPAQPNLAEQCFRQGLAIALERGTHLHALQCTVGLADLLHRQGRGAEMRENLAAAIAAIESKEDIKDLVDAKSLLSAISG